MKYFSRLKVKTSQINYKYQCFIIQYGVTHVCKSYKEGNMPYVSIMVCNNIKPTAISWHIKHQTRARNMQWCPDNLFRQITKIITPNMVCFWSVIVVMPDNNTKDLTTPGWTSITEASEILMVVCNVISTRQTVCPTWVSLIHPRVSLDVNKPSFMWIKTSAWPLGRCSSS